MRFNRITIVYEDKPKRYDLNELLQWYALSLGLFSIRDKDKSRFRIFIILIKSLKNNKVLTSDEIAEKLGLTRGTVIHHLNQMMNSGIVTNQRNKYFLNVKNLEELTDTIKGNIIAVFQELKEIAKEIDDRLEL
ncbi:MAG: winged helix-turn-helix domain-containing protein [Candidatus Woesearchaeota archaeon]